MWRPDDWDNKNPCEECPDKVEDEHGLFCDLTCGKASAYANYEAGYENEEPGWLVKIPKL